MKKSITRNELQLKLNNAEPLAIIDVRSREEFEKEHLPNAINIPLGELKKIARYLNCNTLYVTVCGKGGGRSSEGAEMIREMGLKSAWLEEGTIGYFQSAEE